MIGLDTNVVLRFILLDDRRQAVAARTLLTSTTGSPGFINLVTLAEIVWVLRSGYDFDDAQLLEAVELLVSKPDIVVQEEALVRSAIGLSRATGTGLPDCLISLINRWEGCATTYTFDGKATKLDTMTLVPEPSGQ